jgi:hypothetical protein
MGDADELLLVAEGDDAMPVFEPDRARSPQARRVEAQEFVEEAAACRIGPAFSVKLRLRLACHLCGIMIPHASANR